MARHLALCYCLLACGGGLPKTIDHPADTIPVDSAKLAASVTQLSRKEAAVAATALLDSLTARPESTRLRRRFLQLFRTVFVEEVGDADPGLEAVPGLVLTRVDQFAQAGDSAFLDALMGAALGWYGRTAEGGEWLNEILWENLVVNAQLTVTRLDRLPANVRGQLVERVYTRPVHDGFDFAAVVTQLESATVPASMEADVRRILVVARELSP